MFLAVVAQVAASVVCVSTRDFLTPEPLNSFETKDPDQPWHRQGVHELRKPLALKPSQMQQNFQGESELLVKVGVVVVVEMEVVAGSW